MEKNLEYAVKLSFYCDNEDNAVYPCCTYYSKEEGNMCCHVLDGDKITIFDSNGKKVSFGVVTLQKKRTKRTFGTDISDEIDVYDVFTKDDYGNKCINQYFAGKFSAVIVRPE